MLGRKLQAIFLPSISIILIGSLLLAPAASIEAAKSGLLLWFNTVLPSLLPFIIAANLLVASNIMGSFEKIFSYIMKPLFNVSGRCAFPWIMGLVSGYPMGAKITAEMWEDNQISDIEAQRILAFSNNSGPFFILGAVGLGMLESAQLGYFLLVIHFISSVLAGILFGFYGKNDFPVTCIAARKSSQTKSMGEALGTSINRSMEVILQIGGYIILFSVIGALIKNTYLISLLSKFLYFLFYPFGMSMELAFSWIMGIIEMSNGVSMAAMTQSAPVLKLSIISFIIAWGGLSVHAQSLHLLQKTNVKASIYLIGKLLHAGLAFLLTLFCLPRYLSYHYISFFSLAFWLALFFFLKFLGSLTRNNSL